MLGGVTAERLAERVTIQKYDVTVLGAIYHVVEHFSVHTGQIIFATKMLTGADLGFYRHLSGAASSPQNTLMDLSAFDYHLPEERIAQEPLADRAASRMLVVRRAEGRWEDRRFRELPEFLGPGDCLVLNDSRVFPARLFGHRAGVHSLPVGKSNPKRREHLSGHVEVFLLRPVTATAANGRALVRPGRKMRMGERIRFDGGLEGEIVARGEFGQRTIRFDTARRPVRGVREDRPRAAAAVHQARRRARRPRALPDRVRARERIGGGAHRRAAFYAADSRPCRARGAEIACVTLHVGLGTFQPLHTAQVEQAPSARRALPDRRGRAARKVRAASRVVAVGTTSVRTLESAWRDGAIEARHGETELFIYPGFQFRAVGAMLTNFHLPRTSLLLLVCAFAGPELALAAYRHAVSGGYRFYSYGDCMLIV